jgi:hypothetical protein
MPEEVSQVSAVPPPATTTEALGMLRAAMGYLATADAAQMPAAEQAGCLQALERITAMGTAARTSILAAFTAGQGYCADADYSPRAWLIIILSFRVSQGCELRRPVVDSVVGGTLAA